MGEFAIRARARTFFAILVCGIFLLTSTGCQYGQSISTHQLIKNQSSIDFSGLKEPEDLDAVEVRISAPQAWDELPVKKTALYSHEQWRSPDRTTGVGVVYARLPVPLPMSTLIWLAKNEYTKKRNDGRLLDQWTDELGRMWFEAENNQYHVRGYAVVSGTDAWFVYFGYKVQYDPNDEDLSLAARAMETIIPGTPSAKAELAARDREASQQAQR